jgi:uncharacterized coiled-coil DUF342 family protein
MDDVYKEALVQCLVDLKNTQASRNDQINAHKETLGKLQSARVQVSDLNREMQGLRNELHVSQRDLTEIVDHTREVKVYLNKVQEVLKSLSLNISGPPETPEVWRKVAGM